MHASPLLMALAYSEATMTDRPITRIISAEQALGICRAPIVGPDQRTLLDARPPEAPAAPSPQAVPVPCSAAGPRTFVEGVPPSLVQHTAQALYGTNTPHGDARRLRPDQATMLDGVPAPIAPASPTVAQPPPPPSLVAVHSALGHPVREARLLAPNQPTSVTGIPAPIVDDIPTVRLVSQPAAARQPAAVSLPPPAAMVRRGHAVAFVVLVSIGAALLTAGIVRALYERPHPAPATPATQSPSAPARDAVLHPRR
jgi:hypothetical protein